MYIIHSEGSLENFNQLDHLNENAIVINGIDGTITLEIDESILKRRLNEYFQRDVTTENEIKVSVADLVFKFRISEIKEIELKSEAYFRLKFLLQEGELKPFMRVLVECGGFLAMGTRPIVKITQKGHFLVMDRQVLEEVKKEKQKPILVVESLDRCHLLTPNFIKCNHANLHARNTQTYTSRFFWRSS